MIVRKRRREQQTRREETRKEMVERKKERIKRWWIMDKTFVLKTVCQASDNAIEGQREDNGFDLAPLLLPVARFAFGCAASQA